MKILATTLSAQNVSTPYMAIQVGSGHPSKSWPAEYWIQFLEIFAPAAAFPVVILGDESWRRDADDIIAALKPARVSMANLCGVPFDQLMPAIAKASYFIGACSGPRHLAMALNVPTFTLYAASEPLRWGASENHHLHGYINALPQKLSGMELQHISEDHRIRLLQPADVARAALHHWSALQSSL